MFKVRLERETSTFREFSKRRNVRDSRIEELEPAIRDERGSEAIEGTFGAWHYNPINRNHRVRLSNLANLDNFVSLLLLGIEWRVVQGFWLPEFYIT